MNTATFNCQNFIDYITKQLEDVFKENYWFSFFGNKDIHITDDIEEELPSFPSLTIEVVDYFADKSTSTNVLGQEYTNVVLEIDIYTINIQDNKRHKIALAISNQIESHLQFLGLQHTGSTIFSTVPDLFRRKVEFRCKVHNKTNHIYYES